MASSIGMTGTNGSIGLQGITIAKSKYYILGEYFEFEGYADPWTVSMISILNVLGKPYWEQLKMNNISFSKEIEEFIQSRFDLIENRKYLNDDE